MQTLFTELGSPWENGFNEVFDGRFRCEFQDGEVFISSKEAQVITEDYRLEQAHRRLRSSLGYHTPAAFAASCIRDDRSEGVEVARRGREGQ